MLQNCVSVKSLPYYRLLQHVILFVWFIAGKIQSFVIIPSRINHKPYELLLCENSETLICS